MKKYLVILCVVAVGLFSCGGGDDGGSSGTPPPSASFAQADLTGTWDFLRFQTGASSGWVRAVVDFDASGKMTITNFLSSSGSTTPGQSSFIWVLDNSGQISETVDGVPSGFHGQMNSSKKLIVGVVGVDNGTTTRLPILRKRTGTVFTSADLANIPFVAHGLFSGNDNTWERSIGTIDSSGNVSLSSRITPSGTSGPFSNVAKFSVNSVGIVTNSMNLTDYGIMTDDKKNMFIINTADVNKYSAMGVQITGQTYTQSDLAFVQYFNVINSATLANPGWAYGSGTIDNVGNGTYLTYKDSANAAMPGPYTRVLSTTGVITDPTSPTSNGQLSYNKDLTVRTGTSTTNGRNQLVIGFK